MKLQRLYSLTRQAMDDYNMIQRNDLVAVGLSGGKDSITLLYALAGLKDFYPIPFSVCAILVDLGYPEFDISPLETMCDHLSIPFYVVHTQISDILAEKDNGKPFCSLCAKMRKGALMNKAKELGCTKVAYAHHMDDFVETAMMSLFLEGRFYAFPPVTYMEDIGIDVLRPLMYVTEADVIGFKNKYDLTIVKNPCPYDGVTKREEIKRYLAQLHKEHPEIKKNIFHAITTGNIYDWPPKKE